MVRLPGGKVAWHRISFEINDPARRWIHEVRASGVNIYDALKGDKWKIYRYSRHRIQNGYLWLAGVSAELKRGVVPEVIDFTYMFVTVKN